MQRPNYQSAARRSWVLRGFGRASRRRRGPVALRPRVSPGVPFHQGTTVYGRRVRRSIRPFLPMGEGALRSHAPRSRQGRPLRIHGPGRVELFISRLAAAQARRRPAPAGVSPSESTPALPAGASSRWIVCYWERYRRPPPSPAARSRPRREGASGRPWSQDSPDREGPL
jgi:hypothetical protein